AVEAEDVARSDDDLAPAVPAGVQVPAVRGGAGGERPGRRRGGGGGRGTVRRRRLVAVAGGEEEDGQQRGDEEGQAVRGGPVRDGHRETLGDHSAQGDDFRG